MYDDNRYELECKYTQAVAVHSRPVTARLDLAPLARALNRLEDAAALGPVRGRGRVTLLLLRLRFQRSVPRSSLSLLSRLSLPPTTPFRRPATSLSTNANGNRQRNRQELSWGAARFTDSGPILRLDPKGRALTKAQRYGAAAGPRLFRPLSPPPFVPLLSHSTQHMHARNSQRHHHHH